MILFAGVSQGKLEIVTCFVRHEQDYSVFFFKDV